MSASVFLLIIFRPQRQLTLLKMNSFQFQMSNLLIGKKLSSDWITQNRLTTFVLIRLGWTFPVHLKIAIVPIFQISRASTKY